MQCVMTEEKLSLFKMFLLTHASLSIWSALHTRRADTHEGTDQVLTGHTLRVTVIQTL